MTERSYVGVVSDPVAAVAYGGFALAVVGSLGPWVTAPLGSVSGTSGDGQWTVLLAVGGILTLWFHGHQPITLAAVASTLILALGVYNAIHIHHAIAGVTVLGHQVDHVGWGVYVVILGATATLVALVRARQNEKPPPPR